jgi:hypothetical protein
VFNYCSQNGQGWSGVVEGLECAHPANVSWLDILVKPYHYRAFVAGRGAPRSLLALRRDFPAPLTVQNLFVAQANSRRNGASAELVELLAHPLPLVVNFALGKSSPCGRKPRLTPPNAVYAGARGSAGQT